MSRHRFVKQINIHDELEDDAIYDDEDDYDLTEEQEIAMNSGLAEIRRILGPEPESGLTDADIKSSLYNSWFDVGQTVEWLLAQQEKARAAKERQDLAPSISSTTSSSIDKDLPPLPVIPPQESPLNDPDAVIDEDWYGAGRYVHPMEHGYDQARDMPRGPLIYQHQQYDYEQEEDLETVYSAPYRPNLSVISERTEKSEASRHWPTRQQLVALGEPRPVSIQTDLTSFRPRSVPGQLVDPNGIPPSPSPSAQQVLSIYQPAPSFITFNSRHSSTIPTPQPEMEQPLQPQDVEGTRTPTPSRPQGLDDGAATVSLSSKSTSTVGPSKAKSKLSQLASSRASSISRRTGTSTLETTSVRTYPALRPSPDSEILSTTSTARPKNRTAPSATGSVETTTSTLPSISTPRSSSSTSFHVNQAIQMALQQEQRDEVTQDIPTAKSATLSSVSTIKLPTPVFISAPLTPTVISSTSQSEKSSVSKSSSLSKSRSASKPPTLSKSPSESPSIAKSLSIAKSPSIVKSPSVSGSAVELPVVSAPSPTPSSASGQPSKLALLAAKAREQKEQKELKQQQEKLNNPLIPRVRNLPPVGPKLPEAHTEYFTPIANGSTATTAITTSYQSLQSLKREPKQRESAAIPETVPITAGEAKQSKLAMKLKRVQAAKEEQFASPAPSVVDEEEKESVPAIFIPGNESNGQRRVSASHSKRKDRHKGTESQISSSSHSRSTVRSRDYDRPPSMTPRSGGFAFDSPSPDEIVLNARRGTSLAQRSAASHAKSSSSSSTRSSSLSASHSISKRTVPAKV